MACLPPADTSVSDGTSPADRFISEASTSVRLTGGGGGALVDGEGDSSAREHAVGQRRLVIGAACRTRCVGSSQQGVGSELWLFAVRPSPPPPLQDKFRQVA